MHGRNGSSCWTYHPLCYPLRSWGHREFQQGFRFLSFRRARWPARGLLDEPCTFRRVLACFLVTLLQSNLDQESLQLVVALLDPLPPCPLPRRLAQPWAGEGAGSTLDSRNWQFLSIAQHFVSFRRVWRQRPAPNLIFYLCMLELFLRAGSVKEGPFLWRRREPRAAAPSPVPTHPPAARRHAEANARPLTKRLARAFAAGRGPLAAAAAPGRTRFGGETISKRWPLEVLDEIAEAAGARRDH